METKKLYVWLFGLGVVTATSLRPGLTHFWYWALLVALCFIFLSSLLFSKTKSDIEDVTFRAQALKALGKDPEKYISFYKTRRNRMLLSNVFGIFVGIGYAIFANIITSLPDISVAATVIYVICSIPFVVHQLKKLSEETSKLAEVTSV